MRAMWTGAITFGLVTVPVKMYTATEDHDVSFCQVHRADGGRIKYLRECQECHHEVEYANISKGFETADGRMLVIEPEDLDELQGPALKEIRVGEFVPADQIDPLLIDKAYYLGPDKTGSRGYALLRQILESTDLIAVVKVAIRQRESLAVLRVLRRSLVLQTLLWPDEVRSTDEIAGLAAVIDADESDPTLSAAKTLIGTMVREFEPDRYTDEYTAKVHGLIEKLAAGGAPRVPSPRKVVDDMSADLALIAALEASVAATKENR